MGVSRDRKRSYASSMKRMVHGNDLMIGTPILVVGVFSGRFDSPLDSFRSAVGEKHLAHSAFLNQLLRRLCQRNIVIKVRSVDNFVNLRFQRVIIRFISITQSKYSDPGSKIQIFFSVHVFQINAFPLFQHHRKPVVRMKHILLRKFHVCATVPHNTAPPHRL